MLLQILDNNPLTHINLADIIPSFQSTGRSSLFAGPVFVREAVTTPRRPRHYIVRSIYVVALLILMCTAWLVLAGTQIIRNVGDMSRFGAVLFQILAPLQLAIMVFLSALVSASAVSQEKDRRTLILLLMTRLSNSELVLGKLMASLLNVVTMLAAALPVFALITWFGGVSFEQVGRVFAVTFVAALAAGSLGSTFAMWREKTFQTLAMTALTLVIWTGAWETACQLAGADNDSWMTAFNPIRAIWLASRPNLSASGGPDSVLLFMVASIAIIAILNLVAILRVRIWNPSREVRTGQADSSELSIWGIDHDLPKAAENSDQISVAEAARAGHVDSRQREASQTSRNVWDNPILWREICTWAYGRKVLVIRIAYLAFFALTAVGLYATSGESTGRAIIPVSALILTPFFLISTVIVNALAVTAITNERDGQALDLLMVTDLSPKEFLIGKIFGVFWVTKEMIVLPLLLCVYLRWNGGISTENTIYVMVGLVVMYFFVNMLGIHCGMIYANSRSAIGVSLGVVFFLFVGVVTCMFIMISFSGSFQTQLAPFLAFILGGSVGLYVALGHRNPSPAIQLAALTMPFATFYSITSFILDHSLAVFLVTTLTYGFTTAAMMMPAVYEFDIAMGRAKTADDD